MKKVIILSIIFAAALTLTASLGLYNNSGEKNLPSEGDIREISDVIKKGETLFDIFKRYNLEIAELFELRVASADIHRLRNLYPGRPYRILLDDNDRINSFIYYAMAGIGWNFCCK